TPSLVPAMTPAQQQQQLLTNEQLAKLFATQAQFMSALRAPQQIDQRMQSAALPTLRLPATLAIATQQMMATPLSQVMQSQTDSSSASSLRNTGTNGAAASVDELNNVASSNIKHQVAAPSGTFGDQEAQESSYAPVGHMPAYNYGPHESYDDGPDKKSKGFTFHFGGGPIRGGSQLITSPMGIFKNLMLPLLPNPR
ncbi:hypothetical protein GZH46_01574, partial [Fragariocoptes setiger]